MVRQSPGFAVFSNFSAKILLAGAGNGIAVALVTSVAVWFWADSLGLSMVIGISIVYLITAALGFLGARWSPWAGRAQLLSAALTLVLILVLALALSACELISCSNMYD